MKPAAVRAGGGMERRASGRSEGGSTSGVGRSEGAPLQGMEGAKGAPLQGREGVEGGVRGNSRYKGAAGGLGK